MENKMPVSGTKLVFRGYKVNPRFAVGVYARCKRRIDFRCKPPSIFGECGHINKIWLHSDMKLFYTLPKFG